MDIGVPLVVWYTAKCIPQFMRIYVHGLHKEILTVAPMGVSENLGLFLRVPIRRFRFRMNRVIRGLYCARLIMETTIS